MKQHKISRPGIWLFLRIWGGIGLQSFGGGASTLFLIRQAFVDNTQWLDAEEFGRYWSLCNLTPGINLLALTILIGRKMRGALGVTVSLVGLLLPSAIITCLLTAGLKAVQTLPAIQAMLRGIIPATAGIMFILALQFATPLLKRGQQEGPASLSASLVIIAAAASVLILLKATVVLVLVCAALAAAVIFTGIQPRNAVQNREQEKEDAPV